MSSGTIELWRQQTPAQRLSNRTILRFQSLADELKNDLQRILPEESIHDVLFVSADRNSSRFDQPPKNRYYNARLLKTFRFEEETLKAWEWIKKCFDPQAGSEWKENLEGFQQLFEKTGVGQWSKFQTAVTPVHSDARREAHDMLINAISSLPYTGFLPSAFDSYAFADNWRSSDRLEPYLFNVEMNGNGLVARICNVFSNRPLHEGAPITTDPWDMKTEELCRLYFPKFIDHFVNGRHLLDDPLNHPEGPYDIEKLKKGGLPKGFFIPVYDFNDYDGRPAGGFEGWLIVESEQTQLLRSWIQRFFRCSRNRHQTTIKAIRQAVLSFASRVSEERMRELVEEDWTGSMTPATFTCEKYCCFGGWEKEPGETDLKLPPDVAFSYVCTEDMTGSQKPLKCLLVPCDGGDLFEFWNWDESHKQWVKETYFKPSKSDIEKVTHIAVRTIPNSAAAPIFLFQKRIDTLLPSTFEYLKNYGYHVARSVKDLYEAAKLRDTERRRNEQSGFDASAHDYSKDLNVIDRLVGAILREVSEIEMSVDALLIDSPQRVDISSRFNDLTRIKEALDLRNRFVRSHSRVRSESRLYPQPEWCVALLRSGFRKDIYDLIRLLVWDPLGWDHYHKLKEVSSGSELPYREVADWARLFAYDERGQHPDLDERLGNYLRSLFIGKASPHASPTRGISVEDFGKRHPPPYLNRHQGMTDQADDQVLWSAIPGTERTSRWLPCGELLPLLVFALRAAFQHAWLRTFLDVASGQQGLAENIFLAAADTPHPSGGFSVYSLDLHFPAPLPSASDDEDSSESPASLPWGDWDTQIAHYHGKVRPWRCGLAKSAPLVVPHSLEGGPTAIHTDPWHFCISIHTDI